MARFAQVFMRIYDKNIQSGEITFSRSGITGGDFTALCINGSYVIPRERLEIIFEKMKLTEEERQMLLDAAEETERLAAAEEEAARLAGESDS